MDIDCTDRILCVEEDPVQLLLFYSQYTGKCNSNDHNPCCVNPKKFLNSKGIDGIDVLCCEGTKTCCSNYSVVHLAMQVSPMEETLRKL